MTEQQPNDKTMPDPLRSERYVVRLNSRDGKVVYAKSMTQKRTVESVGLVIASAAMKIASQSPRGAANCSAELPWRVVLSTSDSKGR